MKDRKEGKAWAWEVPAVITKEDIRPTGALKGCVNALPLTIGDAMHPARSIVFCGFAGAHIGGHKFRGVFRFTPADPDVDYETFTTLPSELTRPRCEEESEVDDVDDSDDN